MRRILLVMGGSEQGWSRHNDEGTFRDYESEARRLIKTAEPWGLECIKFDNDYMLNLPYYQEHKHQMDKTSFGFTFKAIGYYETFKHMSMGDIAFFVDSNHIIEKDPAIFYQIAQENDVFVHDHIWTQYLNKYWTRKDTFVNMECDEPDYWDSLQMQFNISGFKKTPETNDFIQELWEKTLTEKIMFGEGKYPNMEGFKEHRHDQSIYSILVAKYGFPYFNRTSNVWAEFIIPERDGIVPGQPVDNSYRREADRKDIR